MRQLFYVMGPSGAGKDSLMLAARHALDGDPFIFAHRYITRPADATSENFISLSRAEFALRDDNGLFWLTWASHDLQYAIGREVLSWLQQGLTVVLNGSRAYLLQAQQHCEESGVRLIPVWIHCEPRVLAQRLRARGRETEVQIQERLSRATQFVAPEGALVIDNSGTLEHALAQWLCLLKQSNTDV
jgi:ribose 1,5-bisphosphokinase